MEQDERHAELTARAHEMAASGRFPSWRLIQIELRFMEGRREAAGLFDDPELRATLDTVCRTTWRPPAPRPAAPPAPVAPPPAQSRPQPPTPPAAPAPAPAVRRPYRPVRPEAPHGRKYRPT